LQNFFVWGLGNTEIARITGLSSKTVDTHRSNISKRIWKHFSDTYGLHSGHQFSINLAVLVVWCIQQGIFIVPGEWEYLKEINRVRRLRVSGFIPSTVDPDGYVYLFRSKVRKLCKIGFTKNIESRLATLKSATGDRSLKAIAFIAGTRLTERFMLERFKAKKVHGEWFKLNKVDIEQILTIFKG
jgi:hypothetical protein